MKTKNQLTLAVAGSRKTQGIVDACAKLPLNEKVLILTYTTVNQDELRRRIAAQAGRHSHIDIMGWFAFLIGHFVRPFLPFAFPGKRVKGFDFESQPQQYSKIESYERYFNKLDQVRRVHLPQIAILVHNASNGSSIERLCRLYDRIYIDEVQDLCGYDLELLDLLMDAPIPLEMVGDVRQAVIATNERESKNKKYMYMGVWDWFRSQEKSGRLSITQRAETWRCHQDIASLADSLFDASYEFDKTISLNETVTHHDGVFLVKEEDVPEYLAAYSPLFLRHSANCAREKPYEFMNFTLSKGLSCEHVLIWPTGQVRKFLAKGEALTESAASTLYVAITRAEQSVAFVMEEAGQSPFPFWTNNDKTSD